MGISINEIKDQKLRDEVRRLDRKQHPERYSLAGLPSAERQRDDVSKSKAGHANEKICKGFVAVCIIAFRHRLLDDDNLSFGCKWLRDSISKSIGRDDGDASISWHYAQILTKGNCGTIVKIEYL